MATQGSELAGYQPGNDITVTVPGPVNVGDIVVLNKLVGISRTTVTAAGGGTCVVAVEGVFPIAKASALSVTQGAPANLDTTLTPPVLDATGTNVIGYCVDNAAAGTLTVRVKLIPAAK